METGTANKTSNCRVMQALENLSESQVNDFLTGRAPLLLAMKLGEHMMFVQLQLSTSSCSSRRRTLLGGNPAHCSNMNNHTQPREKPNCACNPSTASPVPASQAPGAIIDSVNHLGQGVYSGTFSGTLDPTLQDPTGRPKRDINTILQILNDLLLASPQLRQSAGNVTTTPAERNEYLQQTSKTVLGETVDQTDNNRVEDSLRGKVQTLQKMMQERKLRRQQKRGLKAPYQWSSRVSSARQRMHTSVKFESPLGMDRDVTKTENHAASDATFSTASATAIEHESVLV
ncbi:midnolin-like isoform X2 [Mercenaria mercenaria]|nr:midnolin-like isoform X2 [Mercenaria mercenaria]